MAKDIFIPETPDNKKTIGREINAVIAASEEYFVQSAVRIQMTIKMSAWTGL